MHTAPAPVPPPCATTARSVGAVTAGRAVQGFTLIELLIVIAIMAVATAGVTLAMRDGGQTQLEREGQRLAALLESARAQSRARGIAVVWRADPAGFRFPGLPEGTLPSNWLQPDTRLVNAQSLLLGPDPVIGPQQLTLTHSEHPNWRVTIASDGVGPFTASALAVDADASSPR
jgi:general secretion pathway protein H